LEHCPAAFGNTTHSPPKSDKIRVPSLEVHMARPQTVRQTSIEPGTPIEVKAKHPPFVDQVEAVTIGGEFQLVKWHPWLQSNIDAGWLITR